METTKEGEKEREVIHFAMLVSSLLLIFCYDMSHTFLRALSCVLSAYFSMSKFVVKYEIICGNKHYLEDNYEHDLTTLRSRLQNPKLNTVWLWELRF